MKTLFILILALGIVFGMAQTKSVTQQKKSGTTKKTETNRPPKDDYDPDTLPPYEKACGRIGAKNAVPCECMKHRLKVSDEARDKCMLIEDRQKRIECGLAADPCSVAVVDSDPKSNQYGADGTLMPAHCKRSCTKARCECCHS